MMGFGDEKTDRFESQGFKCFKGTVPLLFFGHPKEDQTGNVIGESVNEMVFTDEMHGRISVLNFDIAL